MRFPRIIAPAAILALVVPGAIAEVCRSASGCEFWDNNYHEFVLYAPDTPKIDVLILPPASPFPLRDIALAKAAAESWEDGVGSFGLTWFKNGFNITTYAVGLDDIPEDALKDPEVLIVISEHNPVLSVGIGQQIPVDLCADQGGVESVTEPHVHDGALLQQVECESGGYTCVALNTSFLLGGPVMMYNLIAHEFGHCLGAGHVGDASDFDARAYPSYDVMSYSSRPTVNCVSNLNVRVLEGIYAPLLDQLPSTFLEPGDYYTMAPSSYAQHACVTPSVGILG